MRMWADMQDI